MRGERCPAPPTGAAAAPDEGDGLRVCVNIPGLNRAASQDLFWPWRVGRGRGYPCNYVCMPFGLVNVGAMYQRPARAVHASHKAQRLAEASQEVPGPREPPVRREPHEPSEPTCHAQYAILSQAADQEPIPRSMKK